MVGLSRTEEGKRVIEQMGAQGVIGNALDGERLRTLLSASRPEQVLHLLTALPPQGVFRARQLRPTNELRMRGTANLLSAAIAAGARRLVAESFVGVYGTMMPARPTGEDEPLPPVKDGVLKDTVLALRSLEDQLRSARALRQIALRIGYLYGAGVPSTDGLIRQARNGKLVVPRGMFGIAPFVHIDDAAAAIVAAIERPDPGFV